ncbi:MAG: CFI-box-CTERM domain-containing protein [Dehalococcoidia bacterium]
MHRTKTILLSLMLITALCPGLMPAVPAFAAMDVLYDGTVNLTPGETFDVTVGPTVYEISRTTPLGALDAAATLAGFTYVVTDKRWSYDQVLLLDDVGAYAYNDPGRWYAYVNDVYKDGFQNTPDGLNVIELADGDTVEFYYAISADVPDKDDLDAMKAVAIAVVKMVASTGVAPTDWTLQLSGARDDTVTRAYFENALVCRPTTHHVLWEDGDGNEWEGMPLWLLVAMIDDDPDVGPDHFNFNDDLAAQGYEVKVVSGDGWSAILDSEAIARNSGYIVANTLNGKSLPTLTEGGKPSWPLHLKGPEVFGGQQVGNIVRIELSGLPESPEGWILELVGDVGDFMSQAEFEDALVCPGSVHYRDWTDSEGNVWSGVPLWVLLGAIDDINTTAHWTFNDALAADGYTVEVIAGDGYSRTFDSTDIARNNQYIVADKINGEELSEPSWPLRLVGDGVADNGVLKGTAVGNIVKIEIPELQTPPAAEGSWSLSLKGKITDVISQAEFEMALMCPGFGHEVTWTDSEGDVWSGMPLWMLAAWVDDRLPHEFNGNRAMAGYTVLVKAGDGYTKDFASQDVAWSNDYIVANMINGEELTGTSWPLRLVGDGVASDGKLTGSSVRNISEIELTDFSSIAPETELHIVKYDEDRVTVVDETTVDYLWMQENLPVIGDGETVYKYQGITFDPDNLWDPEETYPTGFKLMNAVKGTRIRDLCELVGGMGAGTEVILVAADGWKTRLPYCSIYPDPWVYEHQGDAILAWYADGEYVPNYKDGMRLFFTPEDTIYSLWDMHESLPGQYWHYHYSDGINYPSPAGLSVKWVTTIEVYSIPEDDWTLVLDGRDIGGLYYEASKTYFEQALACGFGANHESFYTDPEGNVWGGMALWLLAGFVDDDDLHSSDAFNDALAEAGYRLVITNADGHSVSIDSRDIIRNEDYIIANTLDGVNMLDADENWPLILVGPGVTAELAISQITSMKLLKLATDSRCFIATAAYGTPTAQQINVLREFRDKVLLQDSAGSTFVALYYQLSPPVARCIAGSDFLSTLVRELLVNPAVWMVDATGTMWRN